MWSLSWLTRLAAGHTTLADLFNLAADPGERQNIAKQEPEQVKRLQAKLDAMLRDTKDLMPIPNPEKRANPFEKW